MSAVFQADIISSLLHATCNTFRPLRRPFWRIPILTTGSLKDAASTIPDEELPQIQLAWVLKAKNFSLSHKTLYDYPSFLKEFISASISATSVAEVTGIPRATCIRKLNTLVELKIIAQDKISKRYYLIPEAMSENLVSKKITGEVDKIFSNFFFICIRATGVKT